MKKALSTVEVVLLGALVCILAIGGFTLFNNLKIKLAKMSGVKVETTGSLAYDVNPVTQYNVETCKKDASGSCIIHSDMYGNKYVETTGSMGETVIQYLTSQTRGGDIKDCIGILARGGVDVCYDKKGNKVKCKFDKDGNLIFGTVQYEGDKSGPKVIDITQNSNGDTVVEFPEPDVPKPVKNKPQPKYSWQDDELKPLADDAEPAYQSGSSSRQSSGGGSSGGGHSYPKDELQPAEMQAY